MSSRHVEITHDDPFCGPRQARLFRDARGHWYVEHNKTQNGLWLRMAQITVESTIRFQIGEQRFMLKVNRSGRLAASGPEQPLASRGHFQIFETGSMGNRPFCSS